MAGRYLQVKRLLGDVCIIGSGAAGITIAQEFANAKQKVCLLESGGLYYDKDIADLATLDVNEQSHTYREKGSRLRLLGGSTNHWGGIVCLFGRVYSKRVTGYHTAAGLLILKRCTLSIIELTKS